LWGECPAAVTGLAVGTVFDRARENVAEFLSAIAVFLIAEDRCEEKQAETVAVHVAGRFVGIVRVADQAVAIAAPLAFFHEPVRRPADVPGIFAFADRAAFRQEGHAG